MLVKKHLLCLIFVIVNICHSFGQSIKILHQGTKSSFRGLSVVDERVVWVSGSNGTVGRSINGGKNWQFMQVKGFEQTDFRDIEAFNDSTAIIMGIDCPARIFKTTDRGETWKLMFEDSTKGMFLDAMEFWNEKVGVVVGDPLSGKAFTAKLSKSAETWNPNTLKNRPPLDSGEAFFASSGTNIRLLNQYDMIAVTGGFHSNLLIKNNKIKLPLLQGKESTGANSIAVKESNTYMIVGGDFMKKDSIEGNYCFTKDNGKSWIFSQRPPHGYRSCVEYIEKSTWITCGLNGVDITTDDGDHFQKISDVGFHVCRKSKKGNKVYFAGGGGRIAFLQ